MDSTDRTLLALLVADARLSTSALARRVGLSRTTVQSRIARLEEAGIILGYTTRIGPGKGRPGEDVDEAPTRAHVMIAVAPKQAASVEAALHRIDAVRELSAVSGGFDLIAVVETASIAEINRVIDRIGSLEGVERTNSSMILSTRLVR
ncbi:Lrp/AsnC family transcriptional regulator [Lichenicoccus roseus]|uniref:Lrp/AsnC family transcriptional regulator n=1 Tax=Lichenicoccus roseus TaxID=2683649 RepID=A0A5R9IYP0_9PROT|nr:Lrp/AsnC family transcriptional regulator [Lichenicoccus roseus]TLU70604.1 Lrp/AsnC family transcriptional regulator [Lichenicoccus roseus]